jgi:hypothetical protein
VIFLILSCCRILPQNQVQQRNLIEQPSCPYSAISAFGFHPILKLFNRFLLNSLLFLLSLFQNDFCSLFSARANSHSSFHTVTCCCFSAFSCCFRSFCSFLSCCCCFYSSSNCCNCSCTVSTLYQPAVLPFCNSNRGFLIVSYSNTPIYSDTPIFSLRPSNLSNIYITNCHNSNCAVSRPFSTVLPSCLAHARIFCTPLLLRLLCVQS